jgi:2-polyprenyl-3-methyl-5-hydroxy-6-metoxy-1,4-benzoquinol methylase
MKIRAALIFSVALLWQASAFQAPQTHPVSGRRIAGVMGMNGADWLVRPEREAEEQPEKALDALNLKPAMVVADIGAGVGYMSLRMARRVSKVYANDLQPEMLDQLRKNAAKAGVSNVVTVLGDFNDPKLPANTMDLVLLVDVYHEFSQPQQMLRKIRETLKPDGRLVLLEYRAEDPNVPIIAEHKMTVAQVKAELEAEGFLLQPVIETLPRQHILILTKAASKAAGR